GNQPDHHAGAGRVRTEHRECGNNTSRRLCAVNNTRPLHSNTPLLLDFPPSGCFSSSPQRSVIPLLKYRNLSGASFRVATITSLTSVLPLKLRIFLSYKRSPYLPQDVISVTST